MKTRHWISLAAVAAAAFGLKMIAPNQAQAFAPGPLQQTGAIDPEGIFKQRCAGCHEPAVDRAPDRANLAQRPAAEIVDVLTNGAMAPMAGGLSAQQIAALGAYLGARPAAAAQAARGGAPNTQAANTQADGAPARGGGYNPVITDVMCTANSPLKAAQGSWASWGVDPANTRFQRNPGLKAADVPKLKVKWAFSMPGGSYGQPTVVGDWLFMTSRSGTMYALDAKSGCVHWKQTGLASRTTPMVEYRPGFSPSGWITYIGQRDRTITAVDPQDGKILWKSPVLETHPSSGITGSPILYGNQLFVPLTSGEEGAGNGANYSCCSFRGSLVAIDARTGAKQWQTYMITEPLRPTRKASNGNQLQGPAGAAIWSAPTIDAKRRQVLVATGDSYTDAPTTGADAIVAMDLATGAVKWKTQVTQDDNFIVGCTQKTAGPNCPAPSGPDYDFGSPPIVMKGANGRDVVLSGQKSGIAYGMDPDTGKVLWKNQVGFGSSLGGIEWGMAADDKALFAPNSDLMALMDTAERKKGGGKLIDKFYGTPKPGLTAIDPATGKTLWHTPTPEAPCQFYGDRSRDRAQGCFNASSAAASVIPGAVFSGSTDGWFRAYDSKTGKIIWAFSTTAQTYNTVNGVTGQPGGGIDGMGPTIAGGVVYTMSGYNGASNTGGNGTNVLLAFSVDGK